jgi:hypothetical protein
MASFSSKCLVTANPRPAIALYLCLLLFHFAHVLEEIYGQFQAIRYIGLGWFMIINWLLLCIPVAILYYVIVGKRRAYYCGIIYTAVMIINGLAHNIGYFIFGQYYGGVAGSFTGLAFVIIGPILIYSLRKLLRSN